MRATVEQMELVASEVVERLLAAGCLSKAHAEEAYTLVRRVLESEKALDDALDQEARDLMRQHSAGVWQDGMDSQALHRKIKRKLAEEKGVVV
ncbi:MAG: DUF507 family protein [Acidobacteriota bacterium]|nr:MAG: DUF507 family protein [Acidobacteriota bacterium]